MLCRPRTRLRRPSLSTQCPPCSMCAHTQIPTPAIHHHAPQPDGRGWAKAVVVAVQQHKGGSQRAALLLLKSSGSHTWEVRQLSWYACVCPLSRCRHAATTHHHPPLPSTPRAASHTACTAYRAGRPPTSPARSASGDSTSSWAPGWTRRCFLEQVRQKETGDVHGLMARSPPSRYTRFGHGRAGHASKGRFGTLPQSRGYMM